MGERKIFTAVIAVLLAMSLVGGLCCSCGVRDVLGADDVAAPAEPGDTGTDTADPDSSDTDTGEPDTSEPQVEPDEGDDLETVPADPHPEETAARALVEMGLMKGVGFNDDGTPNLDLEGTLTRDQAVTFLARCMSYSYDAPDFEFSHPFTDVEFWASGSVGYAYVHGITEGVSETQFNALAPVTGRELVTFALRALGYSDEKGDFNWEQACAFADQIGLTEGQLGEGLEPITRGQTAVVLMKLLTTVPRNGTRTYLAELVEFGSVAVSLVEKLGLKDAIANMVVGAAPHYYVSAQYRETMVTLRTQDLMMREMNVAHGSIVADGVAAVPLEALRGASYAVLRDFYNNDINYKGVLAYDQEAGIAYLSCDGVAPAALKPQAEEGPEELPDPLPQDESIFVDPVEDELPTVAGDAEESFPVYIVSDFSILCRDEQEAERLLAMRAVSLKGENLGITTLKGIQAPVYTAGEPMELYDLGKTLWPDELPPFRPRGIDPTKPMTAITYDDGPSAKYTPQLLELLRNNGSVATFFEVGQMVQSHPEFLTQMEAQGCEIANHSWSHPTLTKLSASEVTSQIQRTNDLIKQYVGHDVALVRCPGGGHNATVDAAVGHPMIYWTIDTRDWESKNAAKVIDHVQNDRKSLDGVIILMHSLYASTVEASRTIIPWINQKGYQTVTVSELAYFRGVTLQAGHTYVSFPAN